MNAIINNIETYWVVYIILALALFIGIPVLVSLLRNNDKEDE